MFEIGVEVCEKSGIIVVGLEELMLKTGGKKLFFWSFENFKMIENEFKEKIKECESFAPIGTAKLDHGSFYLENDKAYYVLEGMMGFHIFETSRMVKEDDTLFLSGENGIVKLLDRKTLSEIKMGRVIGLPLMLYENVIPRLIHERESKHEHHHKIIIGHAPEDEDDDEDEDDEMVCVQEYHNGYRTVWMSKKTLDTPVIIDDNYYTMGLPEELESLCISISESREEIIEKARKIPKSSDINAASISFVYNGTYYLMLPNAFEMHPAVFSLVMENIKRFLIEMGAPYVDLDLYETW